MKHRIKQFNKNKRRAMANDLSYIYSNNRLQKYQHFMNSRHRNSQYRINPEDYNRTEEILNEYPIELFSEFIGVKLLDLEDVNLALHLGMVERTDSIVEHEFYPDDDSGNSGRYLHRERLRVGQELYQFFDHVP